MRKGFLTGTIFLLSVLLLGMAPAGWAMGDPEGQTPAQYSYDVFYLTGSGTEGGTLTFGTEQVVFQPKGEQNSHTWNYADLKRIEIRHARLIKIELKNGRDFRFTPVGAQAFDQSLAEYLRNHAGPSVQIRG